MWWWSELPFRLKLVLIFVISILLGVPVWWKTTSLYRAPLPYSEIHTLTSRLTVQHQPWPITINIFFVSSDFISKELTSEPLRQKFLTLLTHYNQDFSFELNFEFLSLGKETINQMIQSLSDDDLDDLLNRTLKSSKENTYTTFIIYHPNVHDTTLRVGKYRHLWIKTSNLNYDYLLNTLFPLAAETLATVLVDSPKHSNFDHTTKEQRMAIKPSHHYHLSFHLVNSDPESRIVTWNFAQIQQNYLSPIISTFSILANITVDSQILHYAPLLRQPKFDSKTSNWYFSLEHLPYFLNLNEWKLDFTPELTPTLNFILYIPSPSQSPLRIRNSDGTYSTGDSDAFLIPQWGGVVFFNLKNTTTTTTTTTSSSSSSSSSSAHERKVLDLSDNLLPAIQAFVSQIRELLGIQDSELRIKSIKTGINRGMLLHSRNGANLWEVDVLIRKHAWLNYNSTQSTLRNYAAMIQELDGIPIPDSISQLVWKSIEQLTVCEEFIFRGQYVNALKSSQRAYEAADEAFFEPGMLALLYFPDEHKYAVYLPLFLPLTVPLVTTLWKELKHYQKKRTERKNK